MAINSVLELDAMISPNPNRYGTLEGRLCLSYRSSTLNSRLKTLEYFEKLIKRET